MLLIGVNMNEAKLIEIMEDQDVIKHGHFLLASGLHSNLYVNKDGIWRSPDLTREILWSIKENIKQSRIDFDIITGPAVAGSIIASNLAVSFNVPFCYPDKDKGRMVFRRGFDTFLNNKKVLLVEDIITTGGSVIKTIDAVQGNNGRVVGIFAIWNRTGWETNIPVYSVINTPVEAWSMDVCQLCQSHIELRDPKSCNN
jgi:orotate phosphoribosyltransferase